jgi:hypothetical protein
VIDKLNRWATIEALGMILGVIYCIAALWMISGE